MMYTPQKNYEPSTRAGSDSLIPRLPNPFNIILFQRTILQGNGPRDEARVWYVVLFSNSFFLTSRVSFRISSGRGEGGEGAKAIITELSGVTIKVVIWYFYEALWKHVSVTPQESLEIQILG